MAKVISTSEMRGVVEANQRAFISQATGAYARLFGRSPTFVSYYSQNAIKSTADINLGGTIDVVGPESPIQFDIINDFPIYGISESDVSSAYDEVRGIISDNLAGEAYILPGTIEPVENDFFTISFMETRLNFRVKQVDPDRLEGNSYYKIQYFLDVSDSADLDEQVVGSYDFELANMGTEFSPILEHDATLLLKEMSQVVDRLRSDYWKAFYSRSSGTVMLTGVYDKDLHDRAVSIFIRRHNLLSGDGYMNARTVIVPDYADRGVYEFNIYPSTIYGMLEAGEKDYSNACMFGNSRPVSPASPFFAEYNSGYYEAIPLPLGSPLTDVAIGTASLISPVEPTFSTPIRRIAWKVLFDGYDVASLVSMKEFVEGINDRSMVTDRADFFWLLPVILLQAKRFRDGFGKTSN